MHALPKRALVAIRGASVTEFLQGLITQDMRKFVNPVISTVFLNPKGRMLTDALIWRNDARFLLDLPIETAGSISSMLTRHKLRAPIDIERIPFEELAVHVNAGVNDPRASELTERMIKRPDGGFIDGTELYKAARMRSCVLEGPSEIPYESGIPVFYNFDLTNSISLAKGCYTGQELITRTLRRGVVRKRCFTVRSVEGTLPEINDPSGTVSVTDLTGAEIGKLVASTGCDGIAMVQLGGAPLNDLSQIQDAWGKLESRKIIIAGSPAELVIPQYMKGSQ
jgi:folate-binding protein YgfZ